MSELLLAVWLGELDWVSKYVDAGLDIGARSHNGYTCLHWAASMGLLDGPREDVVAYLME